MTFTEQFIETKCKFAQLMQQRGWEPLTDREQSYLACVAKKTFNTAVGPKEAIAYFVPSRELFALAQGHYESEGQNILSAMWYPVSAECTSQDMAVIADRYVEEMERKISTSYAMRLKKHA